MSEVHHDTKVQFEDAEASPSSPERCRAGPIRNGAPARILSTSYTSLSVFLLFLNFFLAQYDKFILSYFQTDVLADLGLSPSEYGILSGYATGIVYALLALPVAFVADYTAARVWVLSVAAAWWSLCVLFQGLSRNFWQILLARIGMGIGQGPVEALSVSIISDLVEAKWVFVAERYFVAPLSPVPQGRCVDTPRDSAFYVGVYVGEAVSAQIATAFNRTGTPWNNALKAIGIAGMVLAVVTRLVLREPARRAPLVSAAQAQEVSLFVPVPRAKGRVALARKQLTASILQVVRMRSFWLLTLSAGARQIAGNIFGYYMPSYLSSIYPSQDAILSNYGIIVGR